ncbi:MAG: hypothetical protein HZA77_02280 [Candidatus Schekmanbacteria bacterium]|nr:hypothetical protein [Candidatus Schekmanbacteria bacterium]
MIIKCTQKLLRQLKVNSETAIEPSDSTSKLGDWYANLLYIERKKCLLFTNEKTLFSFFMPCVNKEGFMILPKLFTATLTAVLQEEKIDDNIINEIISEIGDIRYGKTSNRSVLGSMNDIAYHYKVRIFDGGGLFYCDLSDIIRRLNRLPMLTMHSCGIEELKKIFNIPYDVSRLYSMNGD